MFHIPEPPSDIRIERITCVDVVGTSPKMIGKNAVRDDHGSTTTERLVRVFTNTGHDGLGVTRVPVASMEADDIPRALGASPFALVDPAAGIVLHGLEHALWDVIGKVAGLPVYALLGGSVRSAVDAYDGGLYFCDLLDPARGLARVTEEAAESAAHGHRAIKMKVGRGHRWMPPAEGFGRDVEAIRAVRRTIGPDILLMIDGNNGFDRPGAERLLEETGDQDIYWAEEMFPETIEDYEQFRTFLDRRRLRTLIADGETLPDWPPIQPYLERRLIDVVQLDMNQIGLSAWRRLAACAETGGVSCAPHTWSSRFAVYASLHLGKAIPNFLSAEVPAYEPDAYRPAGFTFRDGQYTVSDMPGWGLVIDEPVYESRYRAQEKRYERE